MNQKEIYRDEIERIEHRIEAIEKEEYFAAKKLYERSTGAVSRMLLGFMLFALAVPALQFLAFTYERAQFSNLVEDTRQQIEKATGGLRVSGYFVRMPEDQEMLTLYWTEVRVANPGGVGGLEQIQIVAQGFAEIWGTSENYADIPIIGFRVVDNEEVIGTYDFTEIERRFKLAAAHRIQTMRADFLVNQNTPGSLRFERSVFLDDCDEFVSFKYIVENLDIHGYVEIIPVIQNHDGMVVETTIPFKIVPTIEEFACPLD